MSNKKKDTRWETVEETPIVIAEADTAAEAAAEVAEDVTEAAADAVETAAETVSEAAAEAAEDLTEAAAEAVEGVPASETPEETAEADNTNTDDEIAELTEDSETTEEMSEEDKHIFALVNKLVKKLKEKYSKNKHTAEDDNIITIESDEVILDDDIIAELREQERKEKLRKQIAIGVIGAAAAAITVTLIVRSCKKKKGKK